MHKKARIESSYHDGGHDQHHRDAHPNNSHYHDDGNYHDPHHQKHECQHIPKHDLSKWHDDFLCRVLRGRFETNIDYKIEPLFDFNKYKASISQMLTDYFEDIITTEDKIKFLEYTVAHRLQHSGRYAEYIADLRKIFDDKLFRFLDSIGTRNLLSQDAFICKHLTHTGDVYISGDGKELNLDYILTYIKKKMNYVIKDVNHYFYKSNPSKNDTRLALLLQKIIRLVYFIESINEFNVKDKLCVDLKEVLIYIFSGETSQNFYAEKLSRFLRLDSKYIYENVFESSTNTGVRDLAIRSDVANYFVKRDQVIEKFNSLFYDIRCKVGAIVNLDSLLKVKLSESQRLIQTELQHRVQKAFNDYSKEEIKKDIDYGLLCKHKGEINELFNRLKTFHYNIRNNFSSSSFNDDSFYKDYNEKMHYMRNRMTEQMNPDTMAYNMMTGQAHHNTMTGSINPNTMAFNTMTGSTSTQFNFHGNYFNPGSTANFQRKANYTPDDLFFHQKFTQIDIKNAKEQIQKMIEVKEPTIGMDPNVARLYQDVCSSFFNHQFVNNINFSLKNWEYLLCFEKLILAINGAYRQMKIILDKLDYYKREEKDYYIKLSNHVLFHVFEKMDSDFMYNQDIFYMIDQVFQQIGEVLVTQRVEKPEIDSFNNVVVQKNVHEVEKIRRKRHRRHIDIGVQRLSELVRLSINRLVCEKGKELYNSYAYEDSILQACRQSLRNTGFFNDRHISYYINDKKKYPTEFFKLYLNYFKTKKRRNNKDRSMSNRKDYHPNSHNTHDLHNTHDRRDSHGHHVDPHGLHVDSHGNRIDTHDRRDSHGNHNTHESDYDKDEQDLNIHLLEINYVFKEEYHRNHWAGINDYRFDNCTLDNIKMKVQANTMKRIDVEFEETIECYSIESLMYLAIYQIFYKQTCLIDEPCYHTVEDLSKKRHIFITADNMHEF